MGADISWLAKINRRGRKVRREKLKNLCELGVLGGNLPNSPQK